MAHKKKRIWVDPDFAKGLKQKAAEREQSMLEFTSSIVDVEYDETKNNRKKKRY